MGNIGSLSYFIEKYIFVNYIASAFITLLFSSITYPSFPPLPYDKQNSKI